MAFNPETFEKINNKIKTLSVEDQARIGELKQDFYNVIHQSGEPAHIYILAVFSLVNDFAHSCFLFEQQENKS